MNWTVHSAYEKISNISKIEIRRVKNAAKKHSYKISTARKQELNGLVIICSNFSEASQNSKSRFKSFKRIFIHMIIMHNYDGYMKVPVEGSFESNVQKKLYLWNTIAKGRASNKRGQHSFKRTQFF